LFYLTVFDLPFLSNFLSKGRGDQMLLKHVKGLMMLPGC